jgi:transposase-like protein
MKITHCPNCNGINVVMRGLCHNVSDNKQRYKCNDCKRTFVEADGYERMRHDPEIIKLSVKMQKNGYSLSQIKEHLKDKYDINVSREAIRKWCKKYSDL